MGSHRPSAFLCPGSCSSRARHASTAKSLNWGEQRGTGTEHQAPVAGQPGLPPTHVLHQPHRSPAGFQLLPTAPKPEPRPGGLQINTPSPMASGHPHCGEGGGTAAGMLIYRMSPNAFSPGALGAREPLPSWGASMRSILGKSSQIPPQPPHGAAASGQDGGPGLSLEGTPMGPPSPGWTPRCLQGKGPTRTGGNAQAGAPYSSLRAHSKVHTPGQTRGIFPWQGSKRNISPFYPTI